MLVEGRWRYMQAFRNYIVTVLKTHLAGLAKERSRKKG
jgi:hypothetical protein